MDAGVVGSAVVVAASGAAAGAGTRAANVCAALLRPLNKVVWSVADKLPAFSICVACAFRISPILDVDALIESTIAWKSVNVCMFLSLFLITKISELKTYFKKESAFFINFILFKCR